MPGWRKAPATTMRRVDWVPAVLALLLGAGAAFAEQPDTGGGEPPSMELLEFLADFETEDGEWIGPQELEQMDLPGETPSEPEESEDDADH